MIEQRNLVIGFDIGGTKIGIGIGDTHGKLLGTARIPNVNTYPDDVLKMMVLEVKRLISEAHLSLQDFAAFGISAPFPADAARGIMKRPPNNPHWVDVPILDYMKKNLRLPGCFENDANCGALAEWFFGAGRGCSDLVYLTMSTGIGGGIIASNHLVRGGAALSAGEIGHMCVEIDGRQCNCGQKGCYESYCGGRALAQRMIEELPDHPDSYIAKESGGDSKKIDMILLEKAVRAGDGYALKLWEESAVRNAQAFGILINMLNPQKLILGTLAWAIGDLYTDPIKKHLPRFCWPEPLAACEIVPSALKREIGSFAGIAAATNFLRESAKCAEK